MGRQNRLPTKQARVCSANIGSEVRRPSIAPAGALMNWVPAYPRLAPWAKGSFVPPGLREECLAYPRLAPWAIGFVPPLPGLKRDVPDTHGFGLS